MIACENCSASIPESARFCPSCGGAQVRPDPIIAPSPTEALSNPILEPDATAAGPPPAQRDWRSKINLPSGTDSFAVDSDHVARAGRVALFGTGPLLVLSLVVVVVVSLAAAPDKHHGSILDWIRGGIWLAGLAWHGRMSATIRGNAGSSESSALGTYDATAYATLAPLLLTAFTLAFLAWSARKDERQRPSNAVGQAITRSAVTSALLAVAWFLLSAASRAHNGFGLNPSDYLGVEDSLQARVGVGLSAVATAFSVLVLSFVVTLAARLITAPGTLQRSARLSSWLTAFSAAVRLSVAVAVATTVVAVVYIAVQVVQAMGQDTTAVAEAAGSASDVGGKGPFVGLILMVLMLPNVLISGSGFALGSDLAASGDGTVSGSLPSLLGMSDLPLSTYSYGLFTESDRPTWLYILLLTSLVAALVAGIRSVVRTQPGQVRLATAGQWAVMLALLWGCLTWLASVSFGASGRAAGGVAGPDAQSIGALSWDGRAGLSYAGIIGMAALWAALAYAAGHWVAPRLGGTAPRTVAAIGGLVTHRLHPSWALMLADASVRLEKDPARWLRSAADEAAAGGYAAEQLAIRPGTARKLAVIGGGVTLFALMAVIGQSVLASTTYGPGSAAKAYLDAVASGDASGALDHAVVTGGNNGLLTDKVLRDQLKASPMSSVRVVHAKTGDQDASVEVAYKINGVEQSATLSLSQDQTQPEWGGLFHSWKVDDPFAEVTVSGGGGSVQIGGKPVTQDSAYRFFPGVVTAKTAATTLLSESSSSSQPTGPGLSAELTLTPTLRQNVVDEVRAKVVTMLTDCSKQATLVPDGCPFSSSDLVFGRAVGVNWHATSDMAGAISVDYADGTLSTSGELPMTVRYTDVSDFSPPSPGTDTVTADLAASVTYTSADDITVLWNSANTVTD
jgi:hypothetical protein